MRPSRNLSVSPLNKFLLSVCVLSLIPMWGMALEVVGSKIQIGATILLIFNLALFVTSAISIKQFFFPGYDNTLPFHIFNIVFIVLFYAISLPFLVNNREYYEGYGDLAPISVIGKFFFSLTLSSFGQWVILLALPLNILYIIRYRKDYFEAGIAEPEHHTHDKPAEDDPEKETADQ